MDHKVYTSRYEVHTSTREELNEGWVWLKNDENEELKNKVEGRRPIVRISNSKKHVYCEALYVNDLDLEWFRKKPPFKDVSDDKLIFISQWYLRRLGFEKNPGSAELAIDTKTKISWQFLACLVHPQIMVLLSTVLGIIGVGLGIIGLGLGCIAIPCWSQGIIVGIVFIVVGILVIGYGSLQLFRRAIYNPLR